MVTRNRVFGICVGVVCAAVLTLWASPLLAAGGQTTESQAELRALQRALDGVRVDVDHLPATDGRRSDLQSELDELDDELAYLRVTLRRDGVVSQREVDAYRRRLDAVTRELADGARQGSVGEIDVPVGTEMGVRLQSSLHSDSADVEDRFYGTVVTDLLIRDRVAIPAGAELRGLVSDVDRSSRTDRSASLTLTFDQVTIGDRSYSARLTLTDSQESGLKDEAGRIGIGAGVGGVIGGTKGALTGILIGGGGTVAATEGQDVDLPAGTVLRVRFDTAMTVPTDQ